jgi:hypothetical protein
MLLPPRSTRWCLTPTITHPMPHNTQLVSRALSSLEDQSPLVLDQVPQHHIRAAMSHRCSVSGMPLRWRPSNSLSSTDVGILAGTGCKLLPCPLSFARISSGTGTPRAWASKHSAGARSSTVYCSSGRYRHSPLLKRSTGGRRTSIAISVRAAQPPRQAKALLGQVALHPAMAMRCLPVPQREFYT